MAGKKLGSTTEGGLHGLPFFAVILCFSKLLPRGREMDPGPRWSLLGIPLCGRVSPGLLVCDEA